MTIELAAFTFAIQGLLASYLSTWRKYRPLVEVTGKVSSDLVFKIKIQELNAIALITAELFAGSMR